MTIEEYLEYHETLCLSARLLGEKKNKDYADPESKLADPLALWANLRMCEQMGCCSTEIGIVVRLTDKVSRLANILKPGHESRVEDERIEDTLMDIINYTALLGAYRKETQCAEN